LALLIRSTVGSYCICCYFLSISLANSACILRSLSSLSYNPRSRGICWAMVSSAWLGPTEGAPGHVDPLGSRCEYMPLVIKFELLMRLYRELHVSSVLSGGIVASSVLLLPWNYCLEMLRVSRLPCRVPGHSRPDSICTSISRR
jgi:hypothetical protein